MYLKKTPTRSGRVSLSAVQGYRDNGRVRQRTVETFGFVDELEAEWPDPVAHFEAVVARMDAERLAAGGPQTLTVHPMQKVDKRAVNRMSCGDAVPMAYYDALGIEAAVRSNMRGRGAEFDVNSLMRLLVSERLLAPGSKHAAWERAGRHFFRCDLSESDVYRGLTEIARMRDAVVAKANRSVAAAGIRDLSCGYYDCTNYYFEIDDEDELRRRGVSKEHRKSPIVQMGLLQDANGIPADYHLFAGNVHDSATLIDALPETKRAAGMSRVVVVADKGMNCSENIAATVAAGDGFVYSQSIRGTKSSGELRRWVLDGAGYRGGDDGEFRIKSRQDHKAVHLEGPDGRARDERVDVKVVAFWSRKYAERARRDREKVLEKSRQLVASPGKYTRATHYGAAQFVKNVTFDPDTGEALACASAPVLDLEAIEAAAECDGYYCIVTSETGWSDERILDAYRELWRIEESFKVTKSQLGARPVYVSTPGHIEAHFLTCYIALVIERLIEHALGHRHGAGAILGDLRATECSDAGDGWWLFDHRTDLTDELFALIGEEAPRKWMRRADIKTLFKKGKKVVWGRETQRKMNKAKRR